MLGNMQALTCLELPEASDVIRVYQALMENMHAQVDVLWTKADAWSLKLYSCWLLRYLTHQGLTSTIWASL